MVNHFLKQCGIAKMWVDLVVVFGIVLMIRRRFKQRVKVNPVDPQFLQVVEVVQNPLQVTTVEVLALRMVTGIPRLGPDRIVSLIPIGKPFREDLVPNRVFHPFWGRNISISWKNGIRK